MHTPASHWLAHKQGTGQYYCTSMGPKLSVVLGGWHSSGTRLPSTSGISAGHTGYSTGLQQLPQTITQVLHGSFLGCNQYTITVRSRKQSTTPACNQRTTVPGGEWHGQLLRTLQYCRYVRMRLQDNDSQDQRPCCTQHPTRAHRNSHDKALADQPSTPKTQKPPSRHRPSIQCVKYKQTACPSLRKARQLHACLANNTLSTYQVTTNTGWLAHCALFDTHTGTSTWPVKPHHVPNVNNNRILSSQPSWTCDMQ